VERALAHKRIQGPESRAESRLAGAPQRTKRSLFVGEIDQTRCGCEGSEGGAQGPRGPGLGRASLTGGSSSSGRWLVSVASSGSGSGPVRSHRGPTGAGVALSLSVGGRHTR
jgi:hypothetical protein